MGDEAYRAVFLRVHPTGKMVLSLTTETDGQESRYAQLVGSELGVPPLDVKVVPADTNRFGVGHGFNTSPSGGTTEAIVSATGKIRAKAQLLAGMALETPADALRWTDGAFVKQDDPQRPLADAERRKVPGVRQLPIQRFRRGQHDVRRGIDRALPGQPDKPVINEAVAVGAGQQLDLTVQVSPPPDHFARAIRLEAGQERANVAFLSTDARGAPVPGLGRLEKPDVIRSQAEPCSYCYGPRAHTGRPRFRRVTQDCAQLILE